MKKSIFLVMILFPIMVSAAEYKLESVWATDRVLQVPESVLYNPADSLLYISNINGSSAAADSNGFISKVALDGTIVNLEWVTGLNAPKGSGIFLDKMYVTDIDHLVEIDMRTAKILNRYPAPGAKFLNDVAIDTAGHVYISDSSKENSVIYRFSAGKCEVWARGKEIKSTNGLLLEGQELFIGNSGDGSLKAIDLATRKVRQVAAAGFGIDGLRADGHGNWLVSDWSGRTAMVDAAGQVKVLLDTAKQKINSADIEYIPGMNLLLIPTFFDNRVMGYRLVPDMKRN